MSDELRLALQFWAVAAVAWLFFASIWTGKLRWLDDGLFGPWAVSSLPAWALSLTLFGLLFVTGFVPFGILAMVVVVAGFVLHFVVAGRDPVWAQPRWYREERADPRLVQVKGEQARLTRAVASLPPAPHGIGEVRARRFAQRLVADEPGAVGPATALVARNARLGGLFVGASGLAFVPSDVEVELGRGGSVELVVSWRQVERVWLTEPERTWSNLWALLRNDAAGRAWSRLLVVETDDGVAVFFARRARRLVAVAEEARRGAAGGTRTR